MSFLPWSGPCRENKANLSSPLSVTERARTAHAPGAPMAGSSLKGTKPTAPTPCHGYYWRNSWPHWRHLLRRRALSVRHFGQVTYMARAKRWVTRALPPRMATTRTISSSVRMKRARRQAPARAARTASINRRALEVITSTLPSRSAFTSTSSPPTATAAAPALMNSGVVSRFTPPVGTKSIWGKGPLSA